MNKLLNSLLLKIYAFDESQEELSTEDNKLFLTVVGSFFRSRFRSRKLEAKCFERTLFLGAGDHSIEMVLDLYSKVYEAISIMGGLQQPEHPESAEAAIACAKQQLREEKRLRQIVGDIVSAFGYDPTTLEEK